MRRLFRFCFRLVLVLVVLCALLVAFRNVILRALIERQLRVETGMDAQIGRVNLALGTPTLTLLDVRMFNPASSGGARFLDIPELHLEYDPVALLQKRAHLRLLRLDIGEIHVVRNEAGGTTLQYLRNKTASPRANPGLHFSGIDVLNLGLGRLKFTDLKMPSRNDERFIGLKNQIVRNVRSSDDVKPLMTRLALEKDAKHLLEEMLGDTGPALEAEVPSKPGPDTKAQATPRPGSPPAFPTTP